jgi:hypothetical protein
MPCLVSKKLQGASKRHVAQLKHPYVAACLDFRCVLPADTTYTVSGTRDHYKQQGQAGFVLQQVPEHDNFFSDLKHYPKSTFR